MTPAPDPLTPDEIEQRQHPDGTVEPDVPPRPTDDAPRSPDEIEQRQPATSSGQVGRLDDTDEPLTPDEIEQRTPVGGDDEDQPVPTEDEQLG